MCAQSARSAPAKERCRTHPPVDSSCAPRERGEERTRCGEQRLKRACGARTSSCASVARPSLPAARRSQRSCPACSLFTCRAATCQRAPCAEQQAVGGAPTPGCLRALHSTGRSWRRPVHARRAGQPPGEAVGRERRYANGCEFPSEFRQGVRRPRLRWAAPPPPVDDRTRDDVAAFRCAPSSAVAGFARRRARWSCAFVRAAPALTCVAPAAMAARDTGEARVKVRHRPSWRRHHRPRGAGGAGAPVHPHAPGSAQAAAAARGSTRGRLRAGASVGLWSACSHSRRRTQAPTDVEGQLAELQRKYRILEASALLPRRLRPRHDPALTRATRRAEQPEGVLRGSADGHPSPACRHRESERGQPRAEARAGNNRKQGVCTPAEHWLRPTRWADVLLSARRRILGLQTF